eukprot:2553906-Rhodomonas_salina.3
MHIRTRLRAADTRETRTGFPPSPPVVTNDRVSQARIRQRQESQCGEIFQIGHRHGDGRVAVEGDRSSLAARVDACPTRAAIKMSPCMVLGTWDSDREVFGRDCDRGGGGATSDPMRSKRIDPARCAALIDRQATHTQTPMSIADAAQSGHCLRRHTDGTRRWMLIGLVV